MNLQFEGNPNKKRWQCFSCGVMFEEYEEYRKHIVDQHEEGRDYLICPRCQAPIRDLKLHWKVKHKMFPLPEGVQHRAIIFKTFSNGKAKTKVKFKTGDFISEKQNGKAIHYRSGYELQVYECLEKIDEVVSYAAEPLEIPYIFEGKPKKYRPDIAIYFSDGKRLLVEIKPAKQTALPINNAKWSAAKDFCEARGWLFEVLTEVSIEKLKRIVREANNPHSSSD